MRVKTVAITLLILTPLTLVVLAFYFKVKTDDCLELQPVEPPQEVLKVMNEDVVSIQQIILQNSAAQQEWQDITAFFAPDSDWGGWVTMVKADPRLETPALVDRENPIPLLAEAESTLYIMARNAWKKPHTLRLIFLLDFQPTRVMQIDGSVSSYYDWGEAISPQADLALAVRLPMLSPGLHQLSVLLVTDPTELSEDGWYRFLQQKSFHEDRYDLWVGVESLPTDVPAFESAEMGQAAASRMAGIEFIAQPETELNEALVSLSLKPGQERCLHLRFYAYASANSLYTEPLPLHLAIFWDDKPEQQLIYDLSKDAPDNLTLQIKIKAPGERGVHQLSAVVFQLPGYSQFNVDGRERTGYASANFSRRVLVDVTP